MRPFLIALAVFAATPSAAQVVVDPPSTPDQTALPPQEPFDRPSLGGRRTNGPSLCPVPRGQTVLAILDDFCWLMAPVTEQPSNQSQSTRTHTQWWAYFQPGPRFNSELLVGWATIEVTFDCASRRVLSAAKVAVHDPSGELLDRRRENIPEEAFSGMFRAQQNEIMSRELCAR